MHTRRGMIWSRLWIPEAHQERDALVPFRLMRGTRRGDDLCPRHSKRERVWAQLQPPEAHQKRDDQVSTLGSRVTPEEWWSDPDCRHQRYSRRGIVWSWLRTRRVMIWSHLVFMGPPMREELVLNTRDNGLLRLFRHHQLQESQFVVTRTEIGGSLWDQK